MHHLVLDVPQQVRTLAQLYALTDGERIECHAYPAGAGPGVLEYDIVGLVTMLHPLYAPSKLCVVVVDGVFDSLLLCLVESV